MKKILTSICFLFCFSTMKAQDYVSYFTGDTTNVVANSSFGICLMGGATEDDRAMRWFLNRANGGDVIVLRTSGSNGYNNYLYSQLGVSVNSVETILFNNASAASDPYVKRRIYEAEAVWFAGGDQWTYVQQWRNTAVDSLINYLVNVKKIPVGGTSAGMAILGWNYNSAQNGSVTSAQALSNPMDNLVTVEQNNFMKFPWMKHVITDTHYDNPDRRGRHIVFLSKLLQNNGDTARGIACDEYTAVCVDENGKAIAFGGNPQYDDNAYFVQANCSLPNLPETNASGQPLTWDRNQQALKVYKIKADTTGSQWFDLSNWKTGNGGNWEHWWVSSGSLQTATGTAPDCTNSIYNVNINSTNITYDVLSNQLNVWSNKSEKMILINGMGQIVASHLLSVGENIFELSTLPLGIYWVKTNDKTVSFAKTN